MLAALSQLAGTAVGGVNAFVTSAGSGALMFAAAVQTFFQPLTDAAQTFIVG